MFRLSRFFAVSAAMVVALSTMVVSAQQHFCPDCGRMVSHPIINHNGQSTPAVEKVVQGQVSQVVHEQPVTIEQPMNVVQQVSYEQPVTYAAPIVQQAQVQDSYQSMAQRSANYRASRGIKGHGFTSGQREGVGWSSRSAADAIRQCCYSNSGLPRRVAVVRGNDGWYATTIYLR